MDLNPFHLAIPVRDIPEARNFYGKTLGFPEGRSSDTWIDFNMFGHQLVTHLDTKLGLGGQVKNVSNQVDEHAIPIPHFGVVLGIEEWKQFAAEIQPLIKSFIVEPYIRFQGQVGEQATMFFADPSGNMLEFKGFANVGEDLFKQS